jgi:hypothetical protein
MTSSANWGWRVRDFPLLRWFLKGPWMIRLWRGADWIFEQNVAAVMVVPLLFVSYCLFFYLYLATLRKVDGIYVSVWQGGNRNILYRFKKCLV